jgi:serine/threonine protein kinase
MAGPFDCPRCGTRLPATAAPGRCPRCRAELPARAVAVAVRPAAKSPVGADLVGQLIDGRYRVARVIGKGGYGVVYQAIDERVKRDVAIKMLLEKALDSPEAVARFRREADVLLKIVHPNVLPVFDTGKHGACHYIVMSYVAGKTLKELIPPGGFADPRHAARLAATLAETLHYVYDRHKVLHRDVKPANLMLADGDDSALYLMDFGLAVAQDPTQARLTVDKSMMGTPAYMSPEQVRGVIAGIDHPTDIYSSGVTLYHMLTGRTPFDGSGFEIYVQITKAEPEPPSAIRKDLDPALDRIVLKAMAKNPADRYPTARDFASALMLWVGSQSGVLSAPSSRPIHPASGRGPATPTPLPPPARLGGRSTAVRTSTAVSSGVTPPSWAAATPPTASNRVVAGVALVVAFLGLLVVAAVALRPSSPPPTSAEPTKATDGKRWDK